LSETWRAEIRKRCKEIDEREVELINADEVFARAFAEDGISSELGSWPEY